MHWLFSHAAYNAYTHASTWRASSDTLFTWTCQVLWAVREWNSETTATLIPCQLKCSTEESSCTFLLGRKWGWTPGSDLAFIKQSLTRAMCHNSHWAVKCWNPWKVCSFKWWNDSGRDSSYLHSKFFLFSVVESGFLFTNAEEEAFHWLFPNSIFVTFLCQHW